MELVCRNTKHEIAVKALWIDPPYSEQLAEWLDKHPEVTCVNVLSSQYYPGAGFHPAKEWLALFTDDDAAAFEATLKFGSAI